MTKAGRYAGYALMAATLLIGLGAKQGWIGDFGRLPAVAVAIIPGALGVMLVFTDMMVRGLYTQAEILARAQAETDRAEADETRVDI